MIEELGPDIILLEKIAAGGMAEVFRARLSGTGGFEKIVAVKRVLPSYALQPEFRLRFQEEMNLVALLQHPNIVQVFKNGEYGEYLYLVMEFVDGQSLWKIINECKKRQIHIPVEFACHIVLEIAKGLEFAHTYKDELNGAEQHVIHRDVNPANIMIAYNGGVKLVDFGIAKAAGHSDLTQAGDLRGTLPYCSPEQVAGEKLDLRTDIFSLGVVFWEILTKNRLFAESSSFRIMKQVSECKVPPIRQFRTDVDSDLENILRRILTRDRNQRYQTDQQLFRDLSLYRNNRFPSFVPNDFSEFVTSLFQKEIQEDVAKRRTVSAQIEQSHTLRVSQSEALKMAPPYATSTVGPGAVTQVDFRRNSRIVILVAALMATIAPFVWLTLFPYKSTGNRPKTKQLLPTENTEISSLPGLVSWFRAFDLPQTDDSPVLQWKDSLHGHFVLVSPQPYSAPRLRTTAMHGYPSLQFDGIDDFLIGDQLVQTLRGMNSFSIVMVGAVVREHGRQYVLSMHQADKQSDVLRLGYADGYRALAFSTPEQKIYQITDQPVAKRREIHLLICTFDRSSGAIYINGEEKRHWPTYTLGSLDKAGTLSIGMEWDSGMPSDFFGGFISELLIFNREILENERKKIEQLFMNEYQIQANSQQFDSASTR